MCKRIYAVQIVTDSEPHRQIITNVWNKLREQRNQLKMEFIKNVYRTIVEQQCDRPGGEGGAVASREWSEEEVKTATKVICNGKKKGERERIVEIISRKMAKGYECPGPKKTKQFREEYQEVLENGQISVFDFATKLRGEGISFAMAKRSNGQWFVTDPGTDSCMCILHCGPSAFYVPTAVQREAVCDPDQASEIDAKLVPFGDYASKFRKALPQQPKPPKCGAQRPIVLKHGHPDRHYVLDDFGVPTRRYAYVVKSKYQIEILEKERNIAGRHVRKIEKMVTMTRELRDKIQSNESVKKKEKDRAIQMIDLFMGDDPGAFFFASMCPDIRYDETYKSSLPVDVFSRSELGMSACGRVGDRAEQEFEDAAGWLFGWSIDRAVNDLVLLYIHQWQGSGWRQRGNALAQTLMPLLSNAALPFGAPDAKVFRVDLAQVPVPRPDEPPNLVNYFSRLYGDSLADWMQNAAGSDYKISWSTAKNRELFLRELAAKWIVGEAPPLALECKGEGGAFLMVKEVEDLNKFLQNPKRARTWKAPVW